MHTKEQLQKALSIREQIDPLNEEIAKADGLRVQVQVLEDELNSILGIKAVKRKGTRTPPTEETKAKMRAAWAARKAAKAAPAPVPVKQIKPAPANKVVKVSVPAVHPKQAALAV